MTSVSISDENIHPLSVSDFLICAALVRLPLCAIANFPNLQSKVIG
ncbi:hypothetical protein ECHHL_0934 [Ehrlichia chaffeensis str. Heartland]|nr:hypothetical protein ECHHL_0934 [Ehrlichia chaffeensis str. Heartland]AHX05996.1 hypothetical protein ECHJAX_0950 [Ehrlichia chaffeensis str. Jax]AHX06986.1 hypothetical protein ECHLIB_0953 [Ehrlichia chaffeensis str. Liberty]AHX07509.1 hypothetical protein ECHOSC_0948 [Ehrlichia chaffeensis str. Osceola]AHX08368.1 hypothetical protein ECHSTV_0939 [Ehrlichia chaffeensis str. Saint Vincent]AHX09314.1 hypothetical protein ECHWAK_0950 [Ehrlichia chaffeensis str. Wakulla]AHX10960.1 hypothetica